MDPMTLIMFALLAVLIFFMFRNSRKRQQQQQQLQESLLPGAEVMLTSGIFGELVSIEEGAERAEVRIGNNTIEVHRQAIAKVVTPIDAPEETEDVAPDDDPAFGERIESVEGIEGTENTTNVDGPDAGENRVDGDDTPKA